MRLLPMLAGLFLATAAAPVPSDWQVTTSIAGPDGGWDYASVDAARHRLYIARAESVTVIDPATSKVVGSWARLARGRVVVPLPNGRLLVTSGNDNSVHLLDAPAAPPSGP